MICAAQMRYTAPPPSRTGTYLADHVDARSLPPHGRALLDGFETNKVLPMYETHNDLSSSIRERMVALLSARLADAIDLRTHRQR